MLKPRWWQWLTLYYGAKIVRL